MKALIVDDETHARSELRQLLDAHPLIEVCGEAANAIAAREHLGQNEIDLMFLDIQMPGMSGFDLLASLGEDAPRTIFTTAYDVYALKAFEFGAADYLLKPISGERLNLAIKRVMGQPNAPEVPSPPAEAGSPLSSTDKVLLGDGERLFYVAISTLLGAEAVGPYSLIWLESGSMMIRRSLAALEAKLPKDIFFRANRSQIINLAKVSSVSHWFSASLKVDLPGGHTVELSRRQSKIFRERSAL